MSNPAINWSKQFDLPRREKFILLVLCERADTAGHSFPSIAVLAADTSMSERSIQAGLRTLEALGLVVITGNGGRGLSRQYAVQVDRVVAFDTPSKRVQNTAKRVQKRVQNEQQKGAKDDATHRVHLLSSLDSEREPSEREPRVPPLTPVAETRPLLPDLLAAIPAPPDVIDRAMSIWNETCGPHCGRVLKVVNGRRASFLRRFGDEFDHSLDRWQEFCLMVASSEFLTGKVKKWRADFDWAIESKNVIRIIEGKFDTIRVPDRVMRAAGLDENGHMIIDAGPDNSPFASLK